MQLRPARLVVAEDDAEMSGLVVAALRRDGYQIAEAAGGSGLVELLGSALLRDHEGDLIVLSISDLHMPGWCGLVVLRHLHRPDWAVPFMLVTAHGGEREPVKPSRRGAPVIHDPPDADNVRTRVLNLRTLVLALVPPN